ncbi:DUF1576 domain-containing protein [Ruminococcaceae bacterium OttesenSCG-928-O06]|nr:DUF1576 domain-containing protein [Ruminococcaceae bacterium OttesenSCG-928-O06]
MTKSLRDRFGPYQLFLVSMFVFVVFAFIADAPGDVFRGLLRIFTSRSLLVTDYIAVGGLGASFLNAAITGCFCVGLMRISGVKPNGSTIMAIWLTIGFSFFGKNILNMSPILFGVFLYSRLQKEPFLNYSLVALLSSTLAPVVSEFAFGGRFSLLWDAVFGVVTGIVMGVLLPIVSAATNKVHGGYNLYNVGFAGGILMIFLVALCKSFGITVEPVRILSEGNNLFLAIFLYLMMGMWCAFALLSSRRDQIISRTKRIHGHSGRLVTDYYLMYGRTTYLNMGLLGILGTTITLALGAELNGATLAGIFTMMGFGAFGKHLRNCLPVMAGAVLFAFLNNPAHTEPANILAILFCTGLAPIAGQYGVLWGVLAGMLHTCIVSHTGLLPAGLNLYNNGFAAGFVALLLVPIILAARRAKE